MRVHLFGRFAVVRDGRPVEFEARSAAELVASLALRHGRLTPRVELSATLWPFADPSQAGVSLRKALQRARKGVDLEVEGDGIGMPRDAVETDLDRFERLHRNYQLSPNSPEGLASLQEEWELVREPLLDGWNSAWIHPLRLRYRFYADEIGCELAQALEANERDVEALAVWRKVLETAPQHVEALQNTLRLEATLNKGKGAAAILRSVLPDLDTDDLEIVPKELRRIVAAIRDGREDRLERPEHIRNRSQQQFLASLLEANLRTQGKEAFAFLARECYSPLGQQQPRAMLRLLHTALQTSTTPSPERLDLACQTVYLASICSEFDLGHRWADHVLETAAETDVPYVSALGMKGFMCFEQRRFEEAEALMLRALDLSRNFDDPMTHLRAWLRIGGLWLHLERYDESIEAYHRVLSGTENSKRPQDVEAWVWAHLNLASVAVVRLEWAHALAMVRTCEAHLEGAAMAFRMHPMLDGLCLVMTGEPREGLRQLVRGVELMYEQRLARFNHISLEFAAVGLFTTGRQRVALAVLDAVVDHREALHHDHSPAERSMLLATTGYHADRRLAENPLRMQPLGSLNQVVLEALDEAL